MKLIAQLSFVLILAGCIPDVDPGEVGKPQADERIARIEQNKVIWENQIFDSYMFTYSSYPSDCPQADAMPPVTISVADGAISTVYVQEWGTFIDNVNSYLTIDDIFEQLLEDIAAGVDVFSANSTEKGKNEPPVFDSQYGYPISFFFDISEDTECDAKEVNISGFQ